MDIFDLSARLSLDSSSYENGLKNAKGMAGTIGQKVGNGLKNAAKIATATFAAAGTAVVAFGKKAVEAGANFDKSMSQVAATMGYSVEELQDSTSEASKTMETLRKFAQDMGASTAFSASEAADALNYMALAGYDAETSMKMLPNVLNMAAAGGIDLASASDMVTDAQSALGLSLEETSEMVDKMAMASSKSNTSIGQLGEAFLTVGGTAKTLKGGTTELSTALGILADNGIKGSEGGTALRNIILSLSAPTDKAADTMEALGLKAYDAEGNLRPLNDIFNDLNDIMADMTQSRKTNVLNNLFNKVDLKSANALLANSGKRFDELSGYIDNAQNSAENMANTQLDNLEGDITLLKSAFEGVQIAVSDKLTPTLREFVKFGSDSLQKLTTAIQEGDMSKALEAVGEILSDGVKMIAEAAPKVAEASATLIEAFVDGLADNSDALVESAIQIMETIINSMFELTPKILKAGNDILIQLGNGIAEALPTLIPSAVSMVTELATSLLSSENIQMLIDCALNLVMALAEGLVKAAPVLVESLPTIITSIVDGLLSSVDDIILCGVELLTSLTEDMPTIIDNIVSSVGQITEGIIDSLLDNTDEIAEAGVKLLVALIKNAPKIIATAVTIVPKMVFAMQKAIIGKMPEMAAKGKELLLKLIDGMKGMIPKVGEKAKEVGEKVVNTIKNFPSKMVNIGKNLVEGLWKGITNAKDWIIGKIKGFTDDVLDGIKGFFGIHSPSTETAWMGKMLAEGLGNGWTKASRSVIDGINSDLSFDASVSGERNGSISSVSSLEGEELARIISSAVSSALNSYEIEWNDRNLGRMVRKYAN